MHSATLINSLNKDSAIGIFFYSLFVVVVVVVKTHICPMEFRNTAKRTNPYLIQGLLGSNLQFCSMR